MDRRHNYPLSFMGTILVLMLLNACNLSALSPEAIDCIGNRTPWTSQVEQYITIPMESSGTRVTLAWMLPSQCQPDHYRIVINDIPMIGADPLMDVMISSPEPGPTIDYSDGTEAIHYFWETSDTFLDGYYWWWVIPYYSNYHGTSSPRYRFSITRMDYGGRQTRCFDYGVGAHSMISPIYPGDEQTIHSFTTELIWRDHNPQSYRCNEIWTHRYLILYSQDFAAINTFYEDDDSLNALLDPLPDYLWDFDDGVWFFYGDNWNDIGLVFPPRIFALPVEGDQSVEITLSSCRRVYWTAYHFWSKERNYYFGASGGLFKKSEMRSFDIDPDLCKVEPIPSEAPPTAEFLPPMAVPRERANCRSGPALDYPILSILPAEEQFEIRGRNTDGDAWMLFDPEIDDTCWVNADLVEVIGITDLVEIVIPPPPPLTGPTDTPSSTIVNCSIYDNPSSCSANPACYWDPTDPPNSNGSCKNK